MGIKAALSVFASVIFMSGFVPYYRAVLRGRVAPQASTWGIWLLLDILLLYDMHIRGTWNHLTFGSTTLTAGIVLLSLVRGKRGFTATDKLCLCMAFVAMLFMVSPRFLPVAYAAILTDASLYASLSGLFVAAVPTFITAWRSAESEDPGTWLLFTLGAWGGLATVRSLEPVDVGPMLVCVVNCTAVYAIIRLRRRSIVPVLV